MISPVSCVRITTRRKELTLCNTVTNSGQFVRMAENMLFSAGDFVNVQTFPQDYDFCGNSAQYVCGMSVPPNMMANIAGEIWRQWLGR